GRRGLPCGTSPPTPVWLPGFLSAPPSPGRISAGWRPERAYSSPWDILTSGCGCGNSMPCSRCVRRSWSGPRRSCRSFSASWRPCSPRWSWTRFPGPAANPDSIFPFSCYCLYIVFPLVRPYSWGSVTGSSPFSRKKSTPPLPGNGNLPKSSGVSLWRFPTVGISGSGDSFFQNGSLLPRRSGGDQDQLLPAAELLNGPFPFPCLLRRGHSLLVRQRHRQMGADILPALPTLVGCQPPGQIIGPPG